MKSLVLKIIMNNFIQKQIDGHALSGYSFSKEKKSLSGHFLLFYRVHETFCGVSFETFESEKPIEGKITCPGCIKILTIEQNAVDVNSLLNNGKEVFIHRLGLLHNGLTYNKLSYKSNALFILYFNKDGTQQEGDTVITTDNCLNYLQFMGIDKFGFSFEEIK